MFNYKQNAHLDMTTIHPSIHGNKKMLEVPNHNLLVPLFFLACCPTSSVATPLWPSVRMRLTLPKLGTWSPPGLLNF